jgi:hypothetical protein
MATRRLSVLIWAGCARLRELNGVLCYLVETLLPGVGISLCAHTSLTVENLTTQKILSDDLCVPDGDIPECRRSVEARRKGNP